MKERNVIRKYNWKYFFGSVNDDLYESLRLQFKAYRIERLIQRKSFENQWRNTTYFKYTYFIRIKMKYLISLIYPISNMYIHSIHIDTAMAQIIQHWRLNSIGLLQYRIQLFDWQTFSASDANTANRGKW